jgi:hypothetical protein
MPPGEEREGESNEAPGERFQAAARFRPTRPGALVIYCSDGRFTSAIEELVRARGHESVDRISLPGGPGLLSYSTAGYSERDTVSRAAQFLIQNHGIRRVDLIAHEGCGYYRLRYPTLAADQIRQRQLEDLRGAARLVGKIRSDLEVSAHFARVERGHVTFEALDVAP